VVVLAVVVAVVVVTVGVAVVVVVVLPVVFEADSSLVEMVVLVGKSMIQVLRVREEQFKGDFVESAVLVAESVIEVYLVREIFANGSLVVLVVLVFERLFEILFVREVSLDLAMSLNTLCSFVEFIRFIGEGNFEPARMRKLHLDCNPVKTVVHVSERGQVQFTGFPECRLSHPHLEEIFSSLV